MGEKRVLGRLSRRQNVLSFLLFALFISVAPVIACGDKTPPRFVEVKPDNGTVFDVDTATITGRVDDPEAKVELKVLSDLGGKVVSDDPENFSFEVPLKQRENHFKLVARDKANNSRDKALKLVYQGPIVRSEPPPDSPLPAPGPLPPEPADVATPVEKSVATDMADSTEFLYEGENKVQTGVEPGDIQDKRVAVLKGKVLNESGEPVPGVRITVQDHPEYGETLSREDGRFDLAVNGGGTVTLVYEKNSYMPAQRPVDAPWRDFVTLEDTVLVHFSRRVTEVDLEDTDEMLVARGSATTDQDGTRQATVILPGDTEAEMVMPDGTEKPLPQVDLRATEYTVGEDGPEAMPAPLPPTSAYTYAVELSADKAIETGAEEVRFTEPIYNYVENFLEFPVGENVPSGYYDQEKGQWIPSEDGRVIEILSINNGSAEIDVDGSGNPADAAALASLGVTDAERQKLADLYSEGQTLWRVPVEHLTPWDCNWPYGPPSDATAPPGGDLDDDTQDDPDCQGGSIIECQNQTLHEHVDVSGAPFDLRYGSDGVQGRSASRTLDIPLVAAGSAGSGIPQFVSVKVEVAGRVFRKQMKPPSGWFSTNEKYTFTWDGKDAYDRSVIGIREVSYSVCYHYKPVYYDSLGGFSASFGGTTGSRVDIGEGRSSILVCRDGKGTVASWDDRGQGLGSWTPDILHQYDPAGKSLQLGNGDWRTGDGTSLPNIITTAAGTGEGGTTGDGGPATKAQIGCARGIDTAADGSVYLADPCNHRVRRIGSDGIITTVAGGGSAEPVNGRKATEVSIGHPLGVAVAPDGSFYFTEQRFNRVWRVGTEGNLTAVAGTGDFQGGYSGDGGPATEAKLLRPWGLALAPDGNLYIADSQNHRVRKVSTDGIITTVAGGGNPSGFGNVGDGGLATEALLNAPSSLAIGPDGALYIAEPNGDRVRRVGPDGIITTVAGPGVRGVIGDGGPATQAYLGGPFGVDVGPDGTIYIGAQHHRVRRVGTDGIITTIAGTGLPGYSGDAGPATQASIDQVYAVAVGPDDSLYIGDSPSYVIRKVAAALPSAGIEDKIIASEDGGELYQFNGKGKHLRTLDAVTGTVLYSFSYNERGQLSTVEDVDGLVTKVERNASGDATAIVAPNGERTELTLDANGYLKSVSNPAEETVELTYDDSGGGLLTSLTDPKNNTTRYSYNEVGHLTKEEDPAGSFKALSRTNQGPWDFTTSLTRASERKDTYEVDTLPDGSSRRINTDSSGLTTEMFIGADGTRKVIAPDGSTLEVTQDPDPRFGMQAPMAEATLKTPGGRSITTTASRQVTLAEPNNPSSATTITETVTTEGKELTSTFDKAARTIKDISPEGRIVTTTLDEKGHPILEESPGFAPTSYEYDERGRLTKVTTDTGTEVRTTTYAYDGKDRVSSLTDPSGKEWRFEYDAAGRVVREIGPNGQAISYDYDENGNLTSVTPPGQPAHEFAYDNRNLLTSYDAPQVSTEDRTTSYGYDLDRLPTSQTLPDGGKIEYLYDAGGQLETLRYPGGEKNYSYDQNTGHLTTASNASGTLSYTFDGFLPLSETSSGKVPGKVQLRYDSDLRVAGVSVNGGPEVSYSYNKDDLITKAGLLSISRDAQRGLVSGTTLSNITDQRAYNAFGELKSYEALSGSGMLYDTTFKRDSLGRIVEKTETVGGESTIYAYSYDEEGNLKEVKQNGSVVAFYTYDENGTRLSRITPDDTTEGSYDAQDRLITYGENKYSYTPAGYLKSKVNTATGETTSYDYDALGNLLSVTPSDGKKVEYVVDAADRRVGKKVNGQLVQGFIYQEQLAPVAELDGSGNVVSRFIYGTKSNVPDYMEKNGKTYHIISDHLGSVRLVVDAATGEVAQQINYDEFGNVLNDTNPGFQPFGFAGGIYDPDTKLTRFGARDYDAETGRWTAKDPIRFRGGDSNLYGYVGADPVNFGDPTGLQRSGGFGGAAVCPKTEPPVPPISCEASGPEWEEDNPIGEGLFHGNAECYREARLASGIYTAQCCYQAGQLLPEGTRHAGTADLFDPKKEAMRHLTEDPGGIFEWLNRWYFPQPPFTPPIPKPFR